MAAVIQSEALWFRTAQRPTDTRRACVTRALHTPYTQGTGLRGRGKAEDMEVGDLPQAYWYLRPCLQTTRQVPGVR